MLIKLVSGGGPPPVLLQVKDAAVCGNDVHPVCVVCSDEDGERSVGLGMLHKLLAQDPALALTVLRSLKEWEHGRQCLELLNPQGPTSPFHGHTWRR